MLNSFSILRKRALDKFLNIRGTTINPRRHSRLVLEFEGVIRRDKTLRERLPYLLIVAIEILKRLYAGLLQYRKFSLGVNNRPELF